MPKMGAPGNGVISLPAYVWDAQRRQEALNPRKYRYVQLFDDLPVGSITLWELYSLVLMSMPRVKRCRTTSLPRLF